MQALTRREKEVYDYICATIEQNGYSPSVRDIRDNLGIKSTSTVHSYISRLEEKGYINKAEGKSRTLTLGDDAPTSAKNKSRVPILGQVAAGLPILAEQNIDGYDTIEADINCDFTLVCKGDSMINARIFDGDVVYIKQQPDVENGEIAAVLINDEATLKKVYKYPDKLVLRACNPLYDDFVYTADEATNIHILGKAVVFKSLVRHSK